MKTPKFSPESKYVWIQDTSHPHYPDYVRIIKVVQDGYMAQIYRKPINSFKGAPILFFREDQLSDDLIGG